MQILQIRQQNNTTKQQKSTTTLRKSNEEFKHDIRSEATLETACEKKLNQKYRKMYWLIGRNFKAFRKFANTKKKTNI